MKFKSLHPESEGPRSVWKTTGKFLVRPLCELARFYTIGTQRLLHYEEEGFLALAHSRIKKAGAMSEKLRPVAPNSDVSLHLKNLSKLERIAQKYVCAAHAADFAREVRMSINPDAAPDTESYKNLGNSWTLAIYAFVSAIKQGKKIIEMLGNEGKPRAPMLLRVASLRESLADCFTSRGAVDDKANAAHQLRTAEKMRDEAR